MEPLSFLKALGKIKECGSDTSLIGVLQYIFFGFGVNLRFCSWLGRPAACVGFESHETRINKRINRVDKYLGNGFISQTSTNKGKGMNTKCMEKYSKPTHKKMVLQL